MALQENQIKPLQLDYATIREMLPTATRDRVLRFIGQQHPGDIAVLFKRVGAARSTATFRNLLFHSQSVQDTESAPTGTYQGLIIRFGLGIVAWVWKGNAALGLVAGLTMFLNMLVAATGERGLGINGAAKTRIRPCYGMLRWRVYSTRCLPTL